MSDNGKGPYDLEMRRALVKSWLYPLAVWKQDKVDCQKGSVFHSKLAMKGLGRVYHVFITTSLVCSLTLKMFQTDEAFQVDERKHINTYEKYIKNMKKYEK